jgi:hypothetical protein
MTGSSQPRRKQRLTKLNTNLTAEHTTTIFRQQSFLSDLTSTYNVHDETSISLHVAGSFIRNEAIHFPTDFALRLENRGDVVNRALMECGES